jgi:thiosulfate reductase cytochrome b subunit
VTAAQQRKVQRAVHLVTGLMLVAYVYLTPSGAAQNVIRFVALPVLVATGIAMWQAPRIRRLRQGSAARRV